MYLPIPRSDAMCLCKPTAILYVFVNNQEDILNFTLKIILLNVNWHIRRSPVTYCSSNLVPVTQHFTWSAKGKAIPNYSPGQALRFPGDWGSQISRQSAQEGGKVVSPTHQPPLPPRKYSWYSFLLEAESTPGPQCGRKDYVNGIFKWHHRESNPRPSDL